MAKKNLPVISSIDMNEIYRKIISEVGKGFPEVLICENQPSDMIRYEMSNGRSVLYVNNCDDVCEKIISEMKKPKAEKVVAPDVMIHSLEDEDVSLLCTTAVLISEMLEIPCPQMEFRDFLDGKYGQSVGEKNHVTLLAVPKEYLLAMVRYMAHEMRHLWQYKYHPEYNESYKKAEDGIYAYLDCIAENDAEAWASRLLLEISGVDDITDNEQYVMGNAKLKQRILELRDEIELDGEYVYRLKMLLCA